MSIGRSVDDPLQVETKLGKIVKGGGGKPRSQQLNNNLRPRLLIFWLWSMSWHCTVAAQFERAIEKGVSKVCGVWVEVVCVCVWLGWGEGEVR